MGMGGNFQVLSSKLLSGINLGLGVWTKIVEDLPKGICHKDGKSENQDAHPHLLCSDGEQEISGLDVHDGPGCHLR